MKLNGEVWNTEQKNLFIFLWGGSTPGPPTLPVVKIVLLHKYRFVESFFPQLHLKEK